MEDRQIVELYWSRQEQAIKETQIKYGNYCYSIAHHILQNREDAEESVNDTYLGAWKSMPPHRPQILSSFLGKITRNLSLKKWRDRNAAKRGGGEVPLTLEELKDCVPAFKTVEEEIEVQALAELIDTFLRECAAEERKLFLCRYWYFDSIREIARQFGYSESKVKMQLLRTRAKLRKRLEQEGVTL
ncbi:MAG: sigma-70 family RNA polymerase sigma factor [Clostridia bacterium]|nr:sigma-70 family RNA polymerase sigma factor [Clostridia bacterium]